MLPHVDWQIDWLITCLNLLKWHYEDLIPQNKNNFTWKFPSTTFCRSLPLGPQTSYIYRFAVIASFQFYYITKFTHLKNNKTKKCDA